MNTKKDYCKRKHSMLDPTNVGVRPNNGIRYCKTCAKLQLIEWRMMNKRKKNPAAVALGRLGGLAPKSKPFGLAAVSKKKRKEVSRLGVEARNRKRRSHG